ncbi:MAG: hypothetical protein AAGG08_19600 [Actinomycetota bacterium]
MPPANRPFVNALAEIASTEGRWAVIGGFAVWTHLGGNHRVTLDIDTAAAPAAHQTLVSTGEPGDKATSRIIAGEELEIIEVVDPTEVLDDLDEQQRLFVSAHWTAATTAERTTVSCEELDVEIPVATWLPLIGCKLHAWLDRHSSQDAKRGSDGHDIIELLRNRPEQVDQTGLAMLIDSIAWAAHNVLIDNAARVRRLCTVHSDLTVDQVEIEVLGESLIELLEVLR